MKKAKIVESLVYIASQIGNLKCNHALRTLFQADIDHLNKYGRTITRDKIVAVAYGCVSSCAYTIIEQPEKFSDHFIVANGYLYPAREPILDRFSPSDIEMLDQAISRDMFDYDEIWMRTISGGDVSLETILDVIDNGQAVRNHLLSRDML